MQIKVYHKKAIQNGFFSKSIVEVKISGYNLSRKVVTSINKVLESFNTITEYYWEYTVPDGDTIVFTTEASTMYDSENETEPFDKQKGHDIAENKAIIKAYRTAIKVSRHINNIITREHFNLEDAISSKLSKQIDIRNEIIGD